MFSTELPEFLMFVATIVTFFAAMTAFVAILRSNRAIRYCKDMRAWVIENNKRDVSLKKLAAFEAEMTEMSDAVGQIGKSVKTLRNRTNMRALREKGKLNGDGELPDPKVDPEGWKRAMRLKLRMENS